MQEKVYRSRIANVNELEMRLIDEWGRFDQSIVDAAIAVSGAVVSALVAVRPREETPTDIIRDLLKVGRVRKRWSAAISLFRVPTAVLHTDDHFEYRPIVRRSKCE